MRRVGVGCCAVLALWLATPDAETLGQGTLREVGGLVGHVKRRLWDNQRPDGQRDPDLERLAGEIDFLEHQIENFGSVVPKHPDVWGEARLTRHRAQYESELSRKFNVEAFSQGLQAAMRRSDQSFLALAFALNSAGGGEPVLANSLAAPLPLDSGAIQRSELVPLSGQLGVDRNEGQVQLSLEPVIESNQLSRYLNHLNALRRINEGDDTADSPGYSLNLLRIPVSVLPGQRTRQGYGAEITFSLSPILGDDLLPTTMRSLIVNDIVDQHALPLARLFNNHPACADEFLAALIRVAPRFRNWMNGYDAWLSDLETLGLDPAVIEHFYRLRSYLAVRFLQIALLADRQYAERNADCEHPSAAPGDRPSRRGRPLTFEQAGLKIELANADLASALDRVLGPPTRIGLNDKQVVRLRDPEMIKFRVRLSQAEDPLAGYSSWLQQLARAVGAGTSKVEQLKSELEKQCDGCLKVELDERGQALVVQAPVVLSVDPLKVRKAVATGELPLEFPLSPQRDSGKAEASPIKTQLLEAVQAIADYRVTFVSDDLESRFAGVFSDAFSFAAVEATPVAAPTRSRRAKRPLSSTEYELAIGPELLWALAFDAHGTLKLQPANRPRVHLLDIRSYLGEEVQAAYHLLESPERSELWRFAGPALAEAIRSRNYTFVERSRRAFLESLGPALQYTGFACLAWSILVEASLLEHQLVRDMQQTLSAQGGASAVSCEQLTFLGPADAVSPEARRVFEEYVAARWPVIVFALDPVTQDQNVADSFSRRRELQLAVAVAVAHGELSPSAAGKFVRRLESDIDTIALHRTEVGFSHGNATFGWRFYPRVQTPETAGTLEAFGQNLFGGPSRERERRGWSMEPAQHECVAVAIMPSFIPYVAVESRSHWFGINNPERKELTLRDAMRISNTFQRVQRDLGQLCHSGLYRDQDVSGLTTAVQQLEQRLPLQAMTVQVPYENTLGGFDLFESGVSGLGPELDGWYGAPGVDPRGTTTVFLVGDRFSVLETSVVAGGRQASARLLSRQLMEVRIPAGVQSIAAPQGDLVDVHLATPYGASNHLYIPLVEPAAPSQPQRLTVGWRQDSAEVVIFQLASKSAAAASLQPLSIAAGPNPPLDATLRLRVTEALGGDTVTLASEDALGIAYRQADSAYPLEGAGLAALSELLAKAALQREKIGLPAGPAAVWMLQANLESKCTSPAALPPLTLRVEFKTPVAVKQQ